MALLIQGIIKESGGHSFLIDNQLFFADEDFNLYIYSESAGGFERYQGKNYHGIVKLLKESL